MMSVISYLQKFPISLGILLIAAFFELPDKAAAMTQDGVTKPAEFIQGLADEAISVLSDQRGTIAEREQKFRTVLRDDFAMKKIGRFAIGKYWRNMSTEQKRLYQKLFEEWILKTYSVRFSGYSGETVKVIRTFKAGATDVFVRTQIDSNKRRSLKVDWRVRRIDQRFKIIDIVVEGVSMLITQRAEFSAVLRERGIDGFITILRSQLDQLDAAKPS
tara:strand:+ start:378 stop:1028 length:651 start_codon:yes stop_codon:yes gene_type:complete